MYIRRTLEYIHISHPYRKKKHNLFGDTAHSTPYMRESSHKGETRNVRGSRSTNTETTRRRNAPEGRYNILAPLSLHPFRPSTPDSALHSRLTLVHGPRDVVSIRSFRQSHNAQVNETGGQVSIALDYRCRGVPVEAKGG